MLAGNNNNNIVETKQTTAVASSPPPPLLSFCHTSVPSLPHLNISRCQLSFALLWLGWLFLTGKQLIKYGVAFVATAACLLPHASCLLLILLKTLGLLCVLPCCCVAAAALKLKVQQGASGNAPACHGGRATKLQ